MKRPEPRHAVETLTGIHRVHRCQNITMPGVDLSVAAAHMQPPKERNHPDAQNLQVLPHHEAKKQNIQISEKGIAEVDPEVTVIVDLANPKRLNEDDQVATSHHEDRVVIDHEVDLGIGIWRNQANIVVNVVDDYTKY